MHLFPLKKNTRKWSPCVAFAAFLVYFLLDTKGRISKKQPYSVYLHTHRSTEGKCNTDFAGVCVLTLLLRSLNPLFAHKTTSCSISREVNRFIIFICGILNRHGKELNMSYQHGRKSIREAYEEHFSPKDSREVTVHRVVNIVEKRSPMARPGLDFDRGCEDLRYGGPRIYQSGRGYHSEDSYLPDGSQYYDDNPNYGSYRRNSPPHRNEDTHSQQSYSRDDLRHQLSSRNRSRGHALQKRGRGFGPPPREDYDDYRSSKSLVITRDRSPGRREGQPPGRSGSSSNRSSSPDRDKGYTYQQKHKSNTTKSYTPSSSVEGSPHRSVSSKSTSEHKYSRQTLLDIKGSNICKDLDFKTFETLTELGLLRRPTTTLDSPATHMQLLRSANQKEKLSASAAETEEVTAASAEPKLTPEEDLKARRSEAIKAKVAEIEKHYRQDCETFRTVVKMLVDKEPSLDGLLQAPLDKNLLEIRQHCLDAIKSFVIELDEILEQPDTTA